jgi:hypothetical protein
MSIVMPEPVLLTILLAMNPAISPSMIQLKMPMTNPPMRRPPALGMCGMDEENASR